MPKVKVIFAKDVLHDGKPYSAGQEEGFDEETAGKLLASGAAVLPVGAAGLAGPPPGIFHVKEEAEALAAKLVEAEEKVQALETELAAAKELQTKTETELGETKKALAKAGGKKK